MILLDLGSFSPSMTGCRVHAHRWRVSLFPMTLVAQLTRPIIGWISPTGTHTLQLVPMISQKGLTLTHAIPTRHMVGDPVTFRSDYPMEVRLALMRVMNHVHFCALIFRTSQSWMVMLGKLSRHIQTCIESEVQAAMIPMFPSLAFIAIGLRVR